MNYLPKAYESRNYKPIVHTIPLSTRPSPKMRRMCAKMGKLYDSLLRGASTLVQKNDRGSYQSQAARRAEEWQLTQNKWGSSLRGLDEGIEHKNGPNHRSKKMVDPPRLWRSNTQEHSEHIQVERTHTQEQDRNRGGISLRGPEERAECGTGSNRRSIRTVGPFLPQYFSTQKHQRHI